MNVTIYCDGSGVAGGHPCGFAAILLSEGARKEIVASLDNGTNNVAEIMAAVIGLEGLKAPCTVTVCSDSAYVVNTMRNEWWKKWERNDWQRADDKDKHGNALTWKPVPNAELWKRLLLACQPHRVTFKHVKGHNGDPLNERCDKLAKAARKNHGRKPLPLAYGPDGKRIMRPEELTP